MRYNRKHGHTVGRKFSPTYATWTGMKDRCNDPLNEDYGSKGITYDPRWETFTNFLEDMGERPEGLTLDRIDGSGNYSKENCRWADWETQCNNRSSSRWLEFNGETLSVSQWAKRLGMNQTTLDNRINWYGWSVERALTTPPRSYRKAA